jgi:hypothetical protein
MHPIQYLKITTPKELVMATAKMLLSARFFQFSFTLDVDKAGSCKDGDELPVSGATELVDIDTCQANCCNLEFRCD